MAISQVPISTESFTHKVTSPAWKTKPTWYMVANVESGWDLFGRIWPDDMRQRHSFEFL
jgi:hypothetical protein